MDTILGLMDKLYSNSKALTIVYVVGAVLLLVFIILLIISLKKPAKIIKKEIKPEETKTIENEIKEEVNNNTIVEQVQTTDKIIEEVNNIPDTIKEENTLSQALNNVEPVETKTEIKLEEEKPIEEKVDESKLNTGIPNVDDFVDDVVKKAYEKNEQFSSVYVSNTENIKLDKVLDNLNVDEDVKEAIVPTEEVKEEVKTNTQPISLDALKQQLEDKKNETIVSQDELKDKLASLSNKEEVPEEKVEEKQEAMNPEDLLKKLNAMKDK